MSYEKDNIKSASDFVNDIVGTMTEKRMWIYSNHDDTGYQKQVDEGYEPKIYICPVCDEEWQSWNQQQKIGSEERLKHECNICKNDPERRRSIESIKYKKHKSELEEVEMNKYYEENMPPRYKDNLKDPINKSLLSATCSIIWGSFGVGKTWESCAVIKKLHNDKVIKSFKFISEIALLTDIKNDFNTLEQTVNYYKNVDLLVIDEFGKSNDSDFNKAHMFDILNHRYMWLKKTILICNADKKEDLYKLIPTALLDRFRENIVEMSGKSKRYFKA